MTTPSNVLGPQQLYIPYRISVQDIYDSMEAELPFGRDIDISMIIHDMLSNIFFEQVRRHGPWFGPIGAFLIQAPRQYSEQEQIDIDVALTEYEGFLADTISSMFPQMAIQPHSHKFLYPPQSKDLIIYAPVTSDLPPNLSGKAIPECALHFTLR